MNSKLGDLVVECSVTIGSTAEVVWQTLRCTQAILQPDVILKETRPALPAKENALAPRVQLEASVSMEQRVVEVNDLLMVMRLEMTAGRNVPWLSYHSQVRVEPFGTASARTTMTCLATPTADRQFAEEMLRGVIHFALRAIKGRIEGG